MKRTFWIAGITALAIGTTAFVSASAVSAHGGGKGMRDGAPIVFEELDANSDGKITAEEFETHRKARFDAADTDKDGKLSVEEMTAHMNQERGERATKRLERMISKRDANNDGFLDYSEIGPRNPDQSVLSRFDTDGDGAVSLEEFDAAKDMRRAGRKGGHEGGKDGRHGGERRHENSLR